MDEESRWRQVAKALEYWVLSALVAGSLIYGIIIGVRDVIAMNR